MSFQWLIDNSTVFGTTTQKVVNQVSSRSGRLWTTEYPTTQPFSFTVTPHNYLYFPDVKSRAVLQAILNNDRVNEEIINFNSPAHNNGISDITFWSKYQGDLTSSQLSGLRITGATASTLTVANLPATGTTSNVTVVFRAGDIIQPAGHRYPYYVKQDVYVGIPVTASVIVPLHRPVIGTLNLTTPIGINTGTSVSIPLVATNFPKYTFTPFGKGAYINWDESWQFIENITG